MSELEKATSGANLDSSGSSVSTNENESNVTSGTKDSAQSHIEKLKKELSNYRARVKDFEERDKKLEEEKLLASQQHEKVIGLQKSEIEQLKSKISNYEKRETEGRKSLAIFGELKKLGFVENEANKEIAMRLFDKESVEVDPTANVVIGADIAAKTFYEKFNHLGLFGQKGVGVNQNAPRGVMGKLTLDEWRKLPLDEQVERQKEVEESLGIVRTK